MRISNFYRDSLFQNSFVDDGRVNTMEVLMELYERQKAIDRIFGMNESLIDLALIQPYKHKD